MSLSAGSSLLLVFFIAFLTMVFIMLSSTTTGGSQSLCSSWSLVGLAMVGDASSSSVPGTHSSGSAVQATDRLIPEKKEWHIKMLF